MSTDHTYNNNAAVKNGSNKYNVNTKVHNQYIMKIQQKEEGSNYQHE